MSKKAITKKGWGVVKALSSNPSAEKKKTAGRMAQMGTPAKVKP
jgi:hypothetical protein